MQIDYIVAVGMFIIIFALVLQYVSNYFSTVGENTNMRVMTAQATGLLSVVERGYYPDNWPQATANDSSVVLLLHLDNSTLDATRYGNNGTISGANCSAAVLGKLDSGCSFDGINDYIGTSSSGLGEQNASFTVAAWINVASTTPSWKTIIDENVCSSFDFAVNGLNLIAGRNCGQGSGFTVSKAISANTWYHTALTYNGSTLSLYVNGVLESSNPVNIFIHGGSFCIGSYNCAGAENFNGTIDEVVIYNRSLGADEVYNLYAYENLIDRIGLMTKAYRFYVIVNNTQPFLKNQGDTVRNLANELIFVNYTDLGIGANMPSTFVIDNNNVPIAYQINRTIAIFNASINSNTYKTFTVYFDDDSNFAEQSTTMSGSDNLSEMWLAPQAISIVQYRKLLFLNNSNYTRVKNATQLPRDFSIRLIDIGTSATILNFGPPAPPSGNVVSFRRFTFYQNSTGAVRRGRVTIQVW